MSVLCRQRLANRALLRDQVVKAGSDQISGDVEDLRGFRDQVGGRQIAVAGVGRLGQGWLSSQALTGSGLSCGMPTAWAMVSAVLKPMPQTSAASRYGSFFTTAIEASPYFL